MTAWVGRVRRWCVLMQYSFNVIPKLGEVVANDRDSYQVR
jgi:hypothetical protein